MQEEQRLIIREGFRARACRGRTPASLPRNSRRQISMQPFSRGLLQVEGIHKKCVESNVLLTDADAKNDGTVVRPATARDSSRDPLGLPLCLVSLAAVNRFLCLLVASMF